MSFNPVAKRLYCMGHMLNLVAEAYLFGQDAASFQDDYKKAGPNKRRGLWRIRGELRKLYNLVAHIIILGK